MCTNCINNDKFLCLSFFFLSMNFPLVPSLWASYLSQNVVNNSFLLDRIRALTDCSIIQDAVGTCKFIIYFFILVFFFFLDVGWPRDRSNSGHILIYWAFFASLGYLFISDKLRRVHWTGSTGSLLAGNQGVCFLDVQFLNLEFARPKRVEVHWPFNGYPYSI